MMNATPSAGGVSLPLPGIISDSLYEVLNTSSAVVMFVIATTGVCTNCLNIYTFVKMGLKDGVTVSFLVLSFADLCYSLSYVVGAVCRMLIWVEIHYDIMFTVSPFALMNIFGHAAKPVISCIITAYIATVRCMCVIRPLTFKNTFTRGRSIVFLTGCIVFSYSLDSPVLARTRLVYGWDAMFNMSRYVLSVSSGRQDIMTGIWMFTGTIAPITSQIIVLACVPVLFSALRTASAFRMQAKAPGNKEDSNITNNDTKSEKKPVGAKLDSKDLQVVRQVVFISVIFIVCNIPLIFFSLTSRAQPEFTYGGRYENSYFFTVTFCIITLLISGSLNILIYYNFNTNFRKHIRGIGCLGTGGPSPVKK